MPFTSFAENELQPDGSRPPVWFAFDETRPLAFFAGIWARWTSVRKLKEGQVTAELYGLLTTEPNAEVGAVHPKAMPAILTEARRMGDLADGALGRGEGAAAAAAGRRAAHRRAGRERGCAAGVAFRARLDGTEIGVVAACPPVVDYGEEFQAQAAVEVEMLPAASPVAEMLREYAVMRTEGATLRG